MKKLFSQQFRSLFFTKKRVFLKSGRWWPGLGLNHNYDCGLEQTRMGWSLHCLFLASKSVMEALVRVPQILARVPQNLLPLSFWDGPGGAALQRSLFFFSFCMKRSLIVIELGRCSVRFLSVRPVALHLVDH